MTKKKTEKPAFKPKFAGRNLISAITGLQKTAELIKNVGWTQGEMTEVDKDNKVVGYCVVGAMEKVRAAKASQLALALYLAKRGVCEAPYNASYARDEIMTYNDDTDTTKTKLLNAIKSTVKLLEANKL